MVYNYSYGLVITTLDLQVYYTILYYIPISLYRYGYALVMTTLDLHEYIPYTIHHILYT